VEAIAGGEMPPPELEVLKTPRTGIALTHRLVTLFSGEPTLPAEWSQPQFPYRANAESQLNAWVGRLLGDPAKVIVGREAMLKSDPDNVENQAKELRFSNCVSRRWITFMPMKAATRTTTEIEQRILYSSCVNRMVCPVRAVAHSHDRKSDWGVATSVTASSIVLRTAR
jgi:hypothetical protein